MCIAIVKPQGKSISEERLRICFDHNPDGAGFAYRAPTGMVVVKGFFTFDAFLAAYKQHEVDSTDALIHFRITTRGDDSADNCHPFALGSGALVHNGTISGLGEIGKGKSDTRMLAEELYNERFETLQRLKPTIERSIQSTRVAIMSHDGEVMVLNADQWTEDEGVLYSNTSFRAYKSVITSPYLGGSRYMSGSFSTYSSGYEDYAYTSGYEDEEPDAETPSESTAEFMDIDTLDETYHEGFFWCNGELWVEYQPGMYGRDQDLEDEILDQWFIENQSYPRLVDQDEFVDTTRWYVVNTYQQPTIENQKAA